MPDQNNSDEVSFGDVIKFVGNLYYKEGKSKEEVISLMTENGIDPEKAKTLVQGVIDLTPELEKNRDSSLKKQIILNFFNNQDKEFIGRFVAFIAYQHNEGKSEEEIITLVKEEYNNLKNADILVPEVIKMIPELADKKYMSNQNTLKKVFSAKPRGGINPQALFGILWIVVGIVASVIGYNKAAEAGFGSYAIWYGAIIFGFIKLVRSLS